ncbi:MAG: cytochrome c biogenesis protein CcsA [Paucibacter sp.]|nr:cytochrome c biogenesis protein CcsA [Roseateles sp.]
MILSPDFTSTAGSVLLVASAVAGLAYLLVALTAQVGNRSRVLLLVGWLAHLVALFVDIAGVGLDHPGTRFGFAPALSATLWLVTSVYLVESRFLPLGGAQRVLAGLGVAVVLLAAAFQGVAHPSASPWAPLHWLLGLASYGLFGAAVLHAALLHRAERVMRLKTLGDDNAGMPLLRLERLTFQFLTAGVCVLTLAIALGWSITTQWHWDHKNLLTVLSWIVFCGLLLGRWVFGWRGRLATRWLYLGAVLLLLAYAGSRFVLEVILHRSFPA